MTSRPQRSVISYSASPGSASDDTARLCRCGRNFFPRYHEQHRCLRCRQLQLILDERRGDLEAQTLARKLISLIDTHEGDWQLIDETGQLVWARDLRKRYLAETRPRPVRNNLARWS